jgi:hypothetical protein
MNAASRRPRTRRALIFATIRKSRGMKALNGFR